MLINICSTSERVGKARTSLTYTPFNCISNKAVAEEEIRARSQSFEGEKDKIPIDEIFMIKGNNEQVNLVDLLTADDKTQIKLLDKIHKQFGHRPKEAYVQVLKNADKWLDKFSPMIDTIINKCEGCIMRTRTPDKPAVALPLASDFNEVVTMDLKIWNKNKNE